MTNKTMWLVMLIILLTATGEHFFPAFPFIGIGCVCTYYLGRNDGEANKKSKKKQKKEL